MLCRARQCTRQVRHAPPLQASPSLARVPAGAPRPLRLAIAMNPRLALYPQQEPLVFTSGAWRIDPIREELVAPVQEPK